MKTKTIMGLDIYNTKTNEHLYTLDDIQYDLLLPAFEDHYQSTGQYIDQHGDLTMNTSQQRELLESVNCSIVVNNDNIKQQVQGFREFLKYCIDNDVPIRFLGD